MAEFLRTIQLGGASITVINTGDIQGDWAFVGVTESNCPAPFVTRFREKFVVPVQCVLIQLRHTAILVDASFYDFPSDSPYFIPGYVPPPGLITRLLEIGVAPDQINHVVITHTHSDHYNALTQEHLGQHLPCFPNARHYIGRADWERDEIQQELQDGESLPSRTLGVLKAKDLLDLTTGNYAISDGLTIMAAPGETPGHQIVRVQSEGKTLYCLGDLYHHTIEVEYPELAAPWADMRAIGNSRRMLVESTLAENAFLIAAHIPTMGRLERIDSGVRWHDM